MRKKTNGNASKSKMQESAAPRPESGDRLPLFFSQPQVISLDRHAGAKRRNDLTLAFARRTNSIPLTLADMPEAAKHYPIVLTQADPMMPVAIVGLEEENYFVDEAGRWGEGAYIPSYVRKYPFVLLEMEGGKELALCVDEPALTFNTKEEGDPLYEDGKPSAFANQALAFCAACQDQFRLTREFCDLLKDKGMLVPQGLDVTLASGRAMRLGGFQLIDAAKVGSLSEAEVVDWFKRGMLAALCHIAQSQSNWRNLAALASKRESGGSAQAA